MKFALVVAFFTSISLCAFLAPAGSYFAGPGYLAVTKSELGALYEVAELHKLEHGIYPKNYSELNELKGLKNGWPKDVWGSPYIFELRDASLMVYSSGPNKENDGNAKDDVNLDTPKLTCEIHEVGCEYELYIYYLESFLVYFVIVFVFLIAVRLIFRLFNFVIKRAKNYNNSHHSQP